MAIIFQVNDSTEFLHHSKASRNHQKQSEWQWAKWIEVAMDLTWDPPRYANGWNLGSLKLKKCFLLVDRPRWQKDKHPSSIITKEYPFQTDTVPTEKKVWTILIDLSSEWQGLSNENEPQRSCIISFRNTSLDKCSSEPSPSSVPTIHLGFHKDLLPPKIQPEPILDVLLTWATAACFWWHLMWEANREHYTQEKQLHGSFRPRTLPGLGTLTCYGNFAFSCCEIEVTSLKQWRNHLHIAHYIYRYHMFM